jgi:hypothetical protein
LQLSLQAASPETFGYTLLHIYGVALNEAKNYIIMTSYLVMHRDKFTFRGVIGGHSPASPV